MSLFSTSPMRKESLKNALSIEFGGLGRSSRARGRKVIMTLHDTKAAIWVSSNPKAPGKAALGSMSFLQLPSGMAG